MADDRNEDGTSKNEVHWGEIVDVGCTVCGRPLDAGSHGGKDCGWQN